jgi:hypothetical protein
MAIVLTAALIDGCGGSTHHTSTVARARRSATTSVCTPTGRAVVTRFFGDRLVSLVTHQGVANSGSPTCYYKIRLAHRAPVSLSVQDQRTVEAYFLLERAITELQQVFAPVRLAPAPQTVPHLGLDASWFPAQHYVMTTDGRDLITATVEARSVSARQQRALATAAARAYLGPLDWKASQNMY